MPRRRFALGLSAWRRVKQRWGEQIPPAIALEMGFTARWNSAFQRLQDNVFARQIAEAEIAAPVFLIGHWRSGTTLLHELLAADPQFGFPSTQACMNPHYFLFSGRTPSAKSVTRPMDNLVISSTSPQEDEFALLNLGLPSPYEAFLFPDALRDLVALADPGVLRAEEQARWRHTFRNFLKAVTVAAEGRCLLLKSPTHSLRVPFLMSLFPAARFVHIVRNPLDVYPSTIRMMKEMISLYRIGRPVEDRTISDAVLRSIPVVDEAIASVEFPPHGYVFVQYEALVADPIPTLEGIYGELKLGDFAAALPNLSSAVQSRAWRRAAPPTELPPPERTRLLESCRRVMEKFGYSSSDQR